MYHKKQKVCTKCLKSKSLNSFVKHRGAKDGLYGTCRECKNSYKKAWFQSKKEKIMTSVSHRHGKLKERAKKSGKPGFIAQESYIKLISGNCYYCYSSLKNEKGLSLDRIDANIGYTEDNVLPCCGICNIGRNVNFSVDEWKVGITAILEFRRVKATS